MSRKGKAHKPTYIYDIKGKLISTIETLEELKTKYSLKESIRYSIARGGIVEIEKNKVFCSRKIFNSEDFLEKLDKGENIKSVVRRPGQQWKREEYSSSDKMLVVYNLTGEKIAVYASIEHAIKLSKIPHYTIARAVKVGKVKTRQGLFLETK